MKIIILLILTITILPAFAQEPSTDNWLSPIEEITKMLNSSGFPILISLFSVGMVVFTYFKIQSKNQQSESMLTCFKILSDFTVKRSKENLAKEWDSCTRNNKKVIYSNNIKWEVQRVVEAYNQACALYELGLLNKKQFRKVYGGTIVRTFRMCSDHIEFWRIQSKNDEFCLHFENVAKELINKHDFDQRPYLTPEPIDENQ